ncbi:hypothetical protein L1987_26180 [Smallanthus sonchifolius]|uniref:Uncharacterized protein n=1 Tax=Smallanthus sonchifolius TaxID=185202 RepID=A0ACB9I8J2_9ASTR|nr:hypothetical protein L1987_26180 [Smallanthus sonchifolius]
MLLGLWSFSSKRLSSILRFGDHFQQDWLKKEVAEGANFLSKAEALYEEILHVLNGIEAKNELSDHVIELKEHLLKERYDYIVQRFKSNRSIKDHN